MYVCACVCVCAGEHSKRQSKRQQELLCALLHPQHSLQISATIESYGTLRKIQLCSNTPWRSALAQISKPLLCEFSKKKQKTLKTSLTVTGILCLYPLRRGIRGFLQKETRPAAYWKQMFQIIRERFSPDSLSWAFILWQLARELEIKSWTLLLLLTRSPLERNICVGEQWVMYYSIYFFIFC